MRTHKIDFARELATRAFTSSLSLHYGANLPPAKELLAKALKFTDELETEIEALEAEIEALEAEDPALDEDPAPGAAADDAPPPADKPKAGDD